MDDKRFYVEGFCGPDDSIDRRNSLWLQHCTDIATVDAMKVGEQARITFRSGMGKSDCWVERVA